MKRCSPGILCSGRSGGTVQETALEQVERAGTFIQMSPKSLDKITVFCCMSPGNGIKYKEAWAAVGWAMHSVQRG